MNIITIKDLVFEYSQISPDETKEPIVFTALNNINIEIKKGEFVSILGCNGSGKSTLAKHLNALLLPTKGDVLINANNTKNNGKLWEIRKCAGMVFQNPDNQIIATIVEDDIAFGLENIGIPTEEIINRVTTSLKTMGIYEFKDDPPHFLSGGQKQRVAIAGILAMEPDIIIFDEPTAMLDPVGRDEVIKSALKLNKEKGITVILITHFMEEASLSDRVIVLDKGLLVIDDTPRKVFSNINKMKEIGLDVPQITEISYNLNKLGLNIPKDILTIDEMVGALCLLK